MKRTAERLLAALLGCLLVFLLLEVALRITGLGYPILDPEREVLEQVTQCPDCRRILCVGDSFTYGIGASERMDFPQQLERMLQQQEVDRGTQVFNAGLPGANTRFILEALPRYLDTAQPDVVVVLAGGANTGNPFGLRAYLEGRSSWGRTEELLFQVRVLRLARYIFARLRHKTYLSEDDARPLSPTSGPSVYLRWRKRTERPVSDSLMRGSDLLEFGKFGAAFKVFQAGARRDPGDAGFHWGMGEALRGQRRYPAARRAYQRAIEVDPSDPVPYYAIGEIYQDSMRQGSSEEANWYLRGIKADPGFAPNYFGIGRHVECRRKDDASGLDWYKKGVEADPEDPLCFSQMAMMAQTKSHLTEAITSFLETRALRWPMAARCLAAIRRPSQSDHILAWARHDIQEIIRKSRSHGTKVILQTYPERHLINDVVRQVAQEMDVPLLDQERNIRKLIKSGTPMRELILRDRHYSDAGNRHVATQLCAIVLGRSCTPD